MAELPVTLRVRDSLAYLELCNPPGNSMDYLFFRELARLSRNNFRDLPVRGMIVYGNGRHFSSGVVLDELAAIIDNEPRPRVPARLVENIDTFLALENAPFPVVAAIGGCCIGAGFELALACRYRIAAPRAVFALPETSFCIMPGCGGTIRLPGKVSRGRAVEIILSGRTICAAEALEIGIVDAIADRHDLIAAAEKLIRKSNP